jgi:hypothetical protein
MTATAKSGLASQHIIALGMQLSEPQQSSSVGFRSPDLSGGDQHAKKGFSIGGRYIVWPAAFDVIAGLMANRCATHHSSPRRTYAAHTGNMQTAGAASSQEFIQTSPLAPLSVLSLISLAAAVADDHFCAGKIHALIIDFSICISLRVRAAARSNFTPVKHFEMR